MKTANETVSEKKERNTAVTYRRILRIDTLLADGTYPTIDDLANDREIECSPQTVYRALEFMRDQLNAPIARDRYRKGFYYTDRTFRLPSVWTTEQELIAVSTLKNMLGSLKGTPLYDSAKKILDLIEKSPVKNLTNKFEVNDGDSSDVLDSDWISKRYVFRDDFSAEVDEVVWNRIFIALRENRIIEFDYQKPKAKKLEHRKVKPYQVLKSQEGWSLWCSDLAKKDFRIFTMSKISNVKISQEKFTLPKDFTYESHAEKAEGVWYNSKEQNFKIWLSDTGFEENKNYVWGKNQKLKKCSKGGYEISFVSSNHLALMKKVFSLADDAIPLDPPEFCGEYDERVKIMAKQVCDYL